MVDLIDIHPLLAYAVALIPTVLFIWWLGWMLCAKEDEIGYASPHIRENRTRTRLERLAHLLRRV